MKKRGLSQDFLKAMREKLEHGRNKGRFGWDEKWKNHFFERSPLGSKGMFFQMLQEEIIELAFALESGRNSEIRHEAADVANFAMMIADIHGALKEEK